MKDSIRIWLTEQFGPDEALFEELYGQYATDMKAAAGSLAALIVAGNAAAVGDKGHAMKGMALQMGDAELSERCLALQNAGRAGDLAACAALVPAISASVAAL